MKQYMLLFIVLAIMSACDVYVTEPQYDSRDQIVGLYEVKEYSETFNDYTYYSFRISKSYYSDEININNFYGADIVVKAFVNYNKITIPFQVMNGYEVEGVGTISGDRLYFSYKVRDRYHHYPSDFCETTAWFSY